MNNSHEQVDPSAVTQPTRSSSGLDAYQPVRIPAGGQPPSARRGGCSCGCGWVFLLMLALPVLVYFLAPFRTNFLVLGIDGGLGRGELGRTDTIILGTITPLKPYAGLLSIPRDLWVPIEGVGENRINTAYFFAESAEPGSGPQAAMRVVSQNFDVPVNYYVILRMDGLLQFINAMGGVDVTLAEPTAELPAGTHHLNGEAALVFARSRAGADDFSRMAHGQVLAKAVIKRLLQPQAWPRLPEILTATKAVLNMNIPVWQWPRLGFAVLRLGLENIDNRTISRDMVRPFTTDQGAQVLAPNWEAIGVVTSEMFGR